MAKKILVIDDNTKHDAIMKDLLEKAGYWDVLIAETGEDGVKMAKSERPDLIIIDTVLPGINGFEACGRIRKNSGKDRPKIIVMTGYVDAIDAVKARESGADDYVVKTSDFSILLSTIRSLV